MAEILAWDHAGLRVHSLERSLAFYRQHGFELEIDHGDNRAYEITNPHGIRLSLIVNATYDSQGTNILLDDETRHPGCTHPAFVIDSIADFQDMLEQEGIAITEGPKMAHRRQYLFIRDPDGNVLEFNELANSGGPDEVWV